jgi:hypothetical protein
MLLERVALNCGVPRAYAIASNPCFDATRKCDTLISQSDRDLREVDVCMSKLVVIVCQSHYGDVPNNFRDLGV